MYTNHAGKASSLPLVYTKRVQQKLKRSLTLHGIRLSMRKIGGEITLPFQEAKPCSTVQISFHFPAQNSSWSCCLNSTLRPSLSYTSWVQLSLPNTVPDLAPRVSCTHPQLPNPVLKPKAASDLWACHATLLVSPPTEPSCSYSWGDDKGYIYSSDGFS